MDFDQVYFLSLKGYSYNSNCEITELNLALIEKSKVFPNFSYFFLIRLKSPQISHALSSKLCNNNNSLKNIFS
jgi:hypothetical protein